MSSFDSTSNWSEYLSGMHPIALTPGEPAGIGPDLALQLFERGVDIPTVVVADAEMLADRADALDANVELYPIEEGFEAPRPGLMAVHHVPCRAPVIAGVLSPGNAGYVLETLDTALDGISAGRYSALVTGPVHKSIINEAGIPFSGHTEYLADKTGGWPVMMLAAPTLRVALATTHLALAEVPRALNAQLVTRVVETVDQDLRLRFGIGEPRVLVCGVNPHAGEDGHLGREEVDWLRACLAKLRERGFNVSGPLPADTAFVPHHRDHADVVLAMYHDQGLPVLKALGFGDAVNVTLGLPVIRTSVDHGTALDLAATRRADPQSLLAALDLAGHLVASVTSQ